MRRGAAGRDLRPSDAPILVLSSTPPPYPSRESATLATHGDCKRCALGGAGRKMFSEARCPGSRSRCAAETQHVHVARQRPQQLWSAEDGVTSTSAENCPSWDRTRTLLIQSQACCQLHQGAAFSMELRGLEPLTSWVRSRRSPS